MRSNSTRLQLQLETRTYRLKGITPILGGMPASKAVYTEFIASKAPNPHDDDEIIENLREREEKGITVFARNNRDQICILGRHLKGYMKEALMALKAQYDIGSLKNKIDTLFFVDPLFIPFKRGDEYIIDEDDMLERPLRAETAQGPRVALQSSEMILDPWEVVFEVTLFPNNGSAKKQNLCWEAVELALDYGAYHGIGQWRNGDYGKFIWERIDEEDGE